MTKPGQPTEALQIRLAHAADAPAIASVHIESSHQAYAPLAAVWPAADLVRRAESWRRFATEGATGRVAFVAHFSDQVVGFIHAGRARRVEAGAATEVFVIHVLPIWRGRGVGSALWSAACAHVRGPGFSSMYVDTLEELASCAFYEARGGERTERRPIDFHGARRTHVTYSWPEGHGHELRAPPGAGAFPIGAKPQHY